MMTNTKARHEEIKTTARQVLQAAGGIEGLMALPEAEQGPKFRAMAQDVAILSNCGTQAARNNMAKVMRIARGELAKDNWGGERIPGRGKALGPSPLAEGLERQAVSTRLAPGSKELAQAIAEVLGLPGWGRVVDQALVKWAESDPELRDKLADMGIIVKPQSPVSHDQKVGGETT